MVKALPIGERAVQLRLNELEEKGRLESESVGQALIRWIAEDEPKEEVWEDEAKYFKWSNRFAQGSFTFRRWGVWLFAASGFLMLLLIAIELELGPLMPLDSQHVTLGIATLIYFGSIFIVVWGLFRCLGYLLRYLGEYKLGKVDR